MLVFALRPLGGLAHPVSLVIDLFHFFAFHFVGVCSFASQLGSSIHPVAGFCGQPGLHGSLEFVHVMLHCCSILVESVLVPAAM